MDKQYIRSFGGKILGTIEVDDKGNKLVRGFGGHILGSYSVTDNTTRTFGGKIIAFGDVASGLLIKDI